MFFAWMLVGLAVFTVVYAYVLYPLILSVLSALRGRPARVKTPGWEWPTISITIPAYNEVNQVDDMLESVLALDYPKDRMQILVISDASNDGTDERVRSYADRGVELLRLPTRSGKTAAENAARELLRGDIVLNTDASIRIDRNSVKPLIAQFEDPSVGLASGRDVSVTRAQVEVNVGESTYVGYEMWVRKLETDVSGIVGASGCFYAIRNDLHQEILPTALSRDFAAALITREHGLRGVTVNNAICYVPRAPSLKREYTRKVRTITRGMETLYFKRALLNPLRYGAFSWMLFSHKICRWLAPWTALLGVIGVMALATTNIFALLLAGTFTLVAALAVVGWNWPETQKIPRFLGIPAFLFAGNIAVLHASIRAMRGELNSVWEPTRREAPQSVVAANS